MCCSLLAGVNTEETWKGVAGTHSKGISSEARLLSSEGLEMYDGTLIRGSLVFLHKNSKQGLGDVRDQVEPGARSENSTTQE